MVDQLNSFTSDVLTDAMVIDRLGAFTSWSPAPGGALRMFVFVPGHTDNQELVDDVKMLLFEDYGEEEGKTLVRAALQSSDFALSVIPRRLTTKRQARTFLNRHLRPLFDAAAYERLFGESYLPAQATVLTLTVAPPRFARAGARPRRGQSGRT